MHPLVRTTCAALAMLSLAAGRPTLGTAGRPDGRRFVEEDHIFEYPEDTDTSVSASKPWVKGNFEIHVFQVGQGHSQLIVFPSGYSILVDVFEPSWNTCKGAEGVAAKIKAILGHTHVNVGTASHWHMDHIGYAGYGGFWCLIERGLLTFDKFVDRDGGTWRGDGANGGARNGECDLDEIDWKNAGTVGGTAEKWVCYATDPANKLIYGMREVAKIGSTTQIRPPDEGAEVKIIMTDGEGVKQEDGKTPLSGNHVDAPLPPSENDYCIALRITYGDFRFATAGDTDGEYAANTQFGYVYNDVETPISKTFGEVDFMLVNHHGSGHSSNAAYVAGLNPQASVISCGYNNTHNHPAQEVVNRLLGQGDVYLNNLCSLERQYGKSIIVDGDVVLESKGGEGGRKFSINGREYTSRRAKRAALRPAEDRQLRARQG